MIYKEKKFQIITIVLLLIFLNSYSFSVMDPIFTTSKTENITQNIKAKSLEDIKILAIIANNFGNSYFWVKNQFEQWGCNFTTAGLTAVVPSCSNYSPIIYVTSDILVSEIDREIIKQFDCVYIPAGGHWTYLDSNIQTHEVLEMAYEEGLVVSGICIGTRILARAGSIVDGVKVVYYSMSNQLMQEAGALVISDTPVVSDKRIVTATTGTCGLINPNIYAFCTAIAKAVLDLSAVISVSIEEMPNNSSQYSINIEVTELSDIFYGNDSTEITNVKAFIHPENEDFDSFSTFLKDYNEDNIYTGNFTANFKGRYNIEVNVKSAAWGIEIVRDLDELTFRIPGFTSAIFLFSITLMIIFAKKRKR